MEPWLGNGRLAQPGSQWILPLGVAIGVPMASAAGFYVLCMSTVWDRKVRTDNFFRAQWLSDSSDQRGTLCITQSAQIRTTPRQETTKTLCRAPIQWCVR